MATSHQATAAAVVSSAEHCLADGLPADEGVGAAQSGADDTSTDLTTTVYE